MRHHSRFSLGDRSEHWGHERSKYGDVVTHSVNDDHSDRQTREALLILKVAVNRQEEVEALSG
jgi:hypothetical protein